MANHSQVYLDAVKVTKVLEDLRIASDSYRALQTHIGLRTSSPGSSSRTPNSLTRYTALVNGWTLWSATAERSPPLTRCRAAEDQGQVELSDADTLRLLSAYSDHGYALDQAYNSRSIGACVSRLDKLMEEMPSGESKKKKKAEYQRVYAASRISRLGSAYRVSSPRLSLCLVLPLIALTSIRITPLFFGPERPPPNYVIPQNHLAAVRVCRERKEVAWILARVVLFLEEEKKYHVEDAEMDEQQSKRKYEAASGPFFSHQTLAPSSSLSSVPSPPRDLKNVHRGSADPLRSRHVVHYLNTVPIPMEEPETLTKTYEFSKDSVVFAMYPGTTCFYRAIVLEAPRRRKGTEYLLHFEDDEDETGETPSRSVDPRFVLPVPSQF